MHTLTLPVMVFLEHHSSYRGPPGASMYRYHLLEYLSGLKFSALSIKPALRDVE